jgi:catechol 2,3-dioxygenase-like lactoylglutathione lyase family enzyme
MDLGGFSISLTVKDLAKSKAFYEALGFEAFHGDQNQGWLIMKGKNVNIGLFQGMFEKNIMTFNPGWDTDAKEVDSFTDVRDIQKELKKRGIELTTEADENTSGPANITLLDPDGNPILLDQHR